MCNFGLVESDQFRTKDVLSRLETSRNLNTVQPLVAHKLRYNRPLARSVLALLKDLYPRVGCRRVR